MYLKPDKTSYLNGVKINEYLLTKHNPNKISLPSKRILPLAGVTIHNTDWIKVNAATTPAEQYTRATVNGNMGTVRVHFYVDDKCAWQNLPLDWQSWHAGQQGRAEAHGSHIGNQATLSIECIMGGVTGYEKSEDNAARLAAWLLYTNNMGIDKLYTHNYWCNVRNGVKAGKGESLITKPDGYKGCPVYIIPHWNRFTNTVQGYIADLKKADNSADGNESFKVRVLDVALNIRKAPGTSSKIVGAITDGGIYTIVETAMVGTVPWGKLKSGIGWISLGDKYVIRL